MCNIFYEAVMDNCCVINKGGKIMMGIWKKTCVLNMDCCLYSGVKEFCSIEVSLRFTTRDSVFKEKSIWRG